MIVVVQLFAGIRDVAGVPSFSIELPTLATVQVLRKELTTLYPALATLLARSSIAVNHEYADDADVIFERDEIAIIPPVSGG